MIGAKQNLGSTQKQAQRADLAHQTPILSVVGDGSSVQERPTNDHFVITRGMFLKRNAGSCV